MIHVIYHDDADGLASALAAYIKFKDNAKYYSVNYGDNLPLFLVSLKKEDEVYILDFSYDKDILEKLKERVSKLVVIDHHLSAMNKLQGLDYVIFDVNKSGCVLSYEYFHKDTEMHEMFKLVQDRDLWLFQYENTEAFNLGMYNNKEYKEVSFWYNVYNDINLYNSIIEKGKVILEYRDNKIDSFVKGRKYRVVKWRNYKVAFYNTTDNISNIASTILKNDSSIDLTISFFINKNGTIYFSFRSTNERDVNVNEICEELGGGGHKKAAGVYMKFDEGMKFISQFLLARSI